MVEVPGIEHPVFGWLLVDLRFEEWRQACFVPREVVVDTDGNERPLLLGTQLREGESIVPASYRDHEHCDVCWFKFLPIEYQNPAVPGWVDIEAVQWLCDRCHTALKLWWESNPFPAHWRQFSG